MLIDDDDFQTLLDWPAVWPAHRLQRRAVKPRRSLFEHHRVMRVRRVGDDSDPSICDSLTRATISHQVGNTALAFARFRARRAACLACDHVTTRGSAPAHAVAVTRA
jgi:hypothetical protein